MVNFLPFKLKHAVRILGNIGSQDSSARVASGVISNATPWVWGWPSFCPGWMMVFPLNNCVFPDPVHLVSLRPRIFKLYFSISRQT